MIMVLIEGARDNALSVFLPLFQKRGIEMNVSALKQLLLNKFVSEAGMHALSESGNYYLLGLARYYFNGDLTESPRVNALYPRFRDRFNSDICTRLDALIGILRNAYIDSVGTKFEQPEDFGTLTLDKLLKKYNKKINEALGIGDASAQDKVEKKPTVSEDYTAGSNYTYEILYSYDDAKKYNKATEPGAWCITYGKAHYDGYVRRLGIHYVIFAQNGYENIPRKTTAGFTKNKPHDAYGNSLIAVLQSNKSPEPIFITSRWNHGSAVDGTYGTEADHAYTKEEFLNVIGCDESVLVRAYEQWKENKPQAQNVNRKELNAQKLAALRAFKLAQMHLNGGANPEDLLKLKYLCGNEKGYKGTYMVGIESEGEMYFTLMDRKKLFYDELFINGSDGWNWSAMVTKLYDNFIYIKTTKNDTCYIFDLIRHQFLSIEGTTKFKYHSGSLGYSSDIRGCYLLLAMSGNQVAMFNADTLKIVKTPRGACWFEAIFRYGSGRKKNRNYNGSVDLIYKANEEVMEMVYDSSAGEVYFFNCKTNQFVNIDENDGFHVSEWRGSNYGKYILYQKIAGDYENLVKLQDPDTNKFLNIDGIDKFREIVITKTVISFMPINKDVYYFKDIETNNYLRFNGEILTTHGRGLIRSDCGWVIIGLDKEHIYKKCLLYNCFSHTFYHDNISGYYFNIYGTGMQMTVYTPDGTDKYRTPTAMQAAQMANSMAEGVKRNFKKIFESIK